MDEWLEYIPDNNATSNTATENEWVEFIPGEGNNSFSPRSEQRNPQAHGRPDEEKFTVNALGEKVPDTMQQMQDFGRGVMKGFADAGESTTSLFGGYENPVSKEFLDASRYWADEQIRPEAGSVGEGIADEFTGAAVGGVAGRAADSLFGIGKRMIGQRAINRVKKSADNINEAHVNAGGDDIPIAFTNTKKLMPDGKVPDYSAAIDIPHKLTDQGKAIVKANTLDITEATMKQLPAVAMAENILGKIPIVSSIGRLIVDASVRGVSPFSGKAAIRVRNDFTDKLVAKGYSIDKARKIWAKMIESQSDISAKTGTATGALLGASVDDD